MKQLLWILLCAAGAAAATPTFQLGVNYSEWLGFSANNGAQWLLTTPAPSTF
jgi:hypothetical protein